MRTVLVLGLGEIGTWALELLARSDGVDRIVAAQRDREAGAQRARLARVGSAFQGHAKEIEFRGVDVADTVATARLLKSVRPDVILSSVTRRSPRALMTADVPAEVRARLSGAGFSIWLPWHLLPAAQLMSAVARSGTCTAIVNVAFPDIVNPAIWRRFGTGPVTGAGNIEMVDATLRDDVRRIRSVDLTDVEVTIVASHAFLSAQARPHLPVFLRVVVGDQDVTSDPDIVEAIHRSTRVGWGRTTAFSGFAASAVKNALALLGDRAVRTTVTAPNGLPGGYPAEVSRHGVRLRLPAPLTLPEAVAINEAGNRFDGIDRLGPDGTVYYTDSTVEVMSSLGYDCPELRFAELSERSAQLDELYRRIIRAGA